MKKTTTIILLMGAALPLIFMTVYSSDQATLKIMPFVDMANNSIHCLKCHTPAESAGFTDVTKICDQMCLTCHGDMKSHHKTGVRLTRKTPDVISLKKNRTLGCVSCHDLRAARFDTRSWKAQSMFDAAFRSEGIHKTYYLVERNNDGQLCGRCH